MEKEKNGIQLDLPETPAPENNKSPGKSSAIGEIVNFCSETTAHGLGYTVKSDILVPFRVIWIVIFSCAVIGNCWHLSTIVRAYLAFPVQEVTTLRQSQLAFPHVTICNQIPESHTDEQVLAADSTSQYAQFLQSVSDNSPVLLDYESRTGVAVDDLLKSPNGLFANVNHTELTSIGHSLQNMVIFCTYGGVECDLEGDFQQYFDPTYFNCYTFTGTVTIADASVGSGPTNGLSLILFLESTVDGAEDLNAVYNRYSSTENSYGVRVQVHEQGTLPNPRDSGFNIMPGQSTSVDLSGEKIMKKSPPYGNCLNSDRLDGHETYTYSVDRCIDVCLAMYIYNQCGCVSSHYPIPTLIKTPFHFCDILNDSDINSLFSNFECENTAWLAFSRSSSLKADCLCHEPCVSYDFKPSVSQSTWPGTRYMRDMYQEYVIGHPNATSLKAYQQINNLINNSSRVADMKANVLDNFARVNIYFSRTSVLEHVQEASYSFAALMSNIGGTIGLWAGLSIITILEVVFLIIRLCILCCKARNPNKTQNAFK